ncbi:hypothetical protein AYO44_04595 [Planctomycetaceae bacterium SCGC AG-212-F19]|nr:hypothetical protein AYO44_04595 [Planctomycetaceae bacterium SCGC AG-212-F19]
MDPDRLYARYQELQQYVGWTEDDARRVQSVAGILQPHLAPLVDDFYAEIDRHPAARKVITGGQAQVERLKGTLVNWLGDLLSGPYDRDYVARRWRVGWRHVEIGLDQVYTNVALSRLRRGLLTALEQGWAGEPSDFFAVRRALNTLLDLDLAIIEDAYQAEFTARKQRFERARSEAAFRGLVEAAPCLILIVRPNRMIAYISPFAEQLTGYMAEEVRGQDCLAVLFPEEKAQQVVQPEMDRVLEGQGNRSFDSPIVSKDGSRRWVIWNIQRLADYEGAPALLAVGQDITTVKEAQERALQTERLAGIGQMVTGLAHESGNALARSQACLEMLTLEVEDRPEAVDLVARIQTAQDHLRQIYEEVRGYAAPLKLEREVCDVSAIWRRAWDSLALQRQGRAVAFQEDGGAVDRCCEVDHFRLEQVFRNVLENALAACKDPVRIDIVCADVALAGRPALRVSVRDNGPGLNAEQRQKIFEPFYTTKTKGTGLGMAIVRRIMDAHGGTVAVGSRESPGAEIVLTLPRENPG